MSTNVAQPWFDNALERLAVRRGHRLLVLEPSEQEAKALRSLVGSDGDLTLIAPDRAIAERIAEHGWRGVRVISHQPTGGERFGTYDSVLIAPRVGPVLPTDTITGLLRANLRPGGRFAVDVPAPQMIPDVHAAWLDLGWDEERLAPLSGCTDVEMAEALRAAGLRGVEAALGSHLLHVESAMELVASFEAALQLDPDRVTELAHAIVSHRQEHGRIDVLVHRTHVTGQR